MSVAITRLEILLPPSWQVCNDVSIEPTLQPVPEKDSFPSSANVTDGARMDIAVNSFWGGWYEKCYQDVRIFNPHATSNRSNDINKVYSNHEREKKRLYERRLMEIEHSSFNPLIFSVTGGMANGCSLFYKRLASLLFEKRSQSYSQTLEWLRCCLSFTLLRSAIQCIRGTRSTVHRATHQPTDLITMESNLI